ncbi:ABC transporter substrate-binding protein [Paenibacillus thalictri]|uniref:ABC transporter substrate-binding protein n=1 Tax=Paenibacillus thalictri TaxID=2527873 RepID=A0A4Q9DQZ3_9BACL|nr:ABC transporter substrate-binding protein [Paenibacillus thalictri]TBL77324.1 ABC transporter substrate-binding protein [Paenibacillus thalictri]
MKHLWIKITLAAVAAIGVLFFFRTSGLPSEDTGKGEAPAPHADKFDPPVVITTAKAMHHYGKLRFGDTTENNPITRWARDRLGIIQTNKWIVTDQNEAMATRVKLALSSGEELPDVLFLTNHEIPELLDDLVASDRVMNVEDAFAKYAPPRVKEAFEQNPDVWKTVTLYGKRWGLPQISDGKVGDPILWIRQDWLDRLHLQAPATLDELEALLDAFTNGDPDGNGKRDTVGLALAGKNSLNSWMGDASFLFGAYGEQPYQWNRGQDGRLTYGSIQPTVKTALIRLADWYRKGYLDPDFGTHDEQKAAALFAEGRAGIVSGPGWMGGWPLGESIPAKEGAVFKPYPYPAGPDGKIGRIGSRPSYGSYFFRKGFERMDAVFAYWDQMLGHALEDLDSDFAIGFGEGYDYIHKDGQVVYDFPDVTSTISDYLLFAPGSPPNPVHESIESRVFRGHIQNVYEQKLASTASRLYLEGRIVGDMQLKYAQKNEFIGPDTPTMSTQWPLLTKLEKETFLKIVYGKTAADSFDEFIRLWTEYGGGQITEEVNNQ